MNNLYLQIQQFQHESEIWRRMLYHINDINILLKKRLSELLLEVVEDDVLHEAEQFHNSLIQEDVNVRSLLNEISRFDAALAKNILEENMLMPELLNWHQQLYTAVEIQAAAFNALKKDFNKYVNQNCMKLYEKCKMHDLGGCGNPSCKHSIKIKHDSPENIQQQKTGL